MTRGLMILFRDLTIAALGRELKRAEERAKFLEEERNSRDEVIRHLEETIGNMQRYLSLIFKTQ